MLMTNKNEWIIKKLNYLSVVLLEHEQPHTEKRLGKICSGIIAYVSMWLNVSVCPCDELAAWPVDIGINAAQKGGQKNESMDRCLCNSLLATLLLIQFPRLILFILYLVCGTYLNGKSLIIKDLLMWSLCFWFCLVPCLVSYFFYRFRIAVFVVFHLDFYSTLCSVFRLSLLFRFPCAIILILPSVYSL